MEADFSGYATKNGLKCSDGRTIMPDAFKHNDQQRVPLVWQHMHGDSNNVLGHAVLENRPDGVYAYGYFNETDNGKNAKLMVQHGDINALSIYAGNLAQRGDNVHHGDIKEVSLVLSGANPGAFIDNVNLKHGDSYETLIDEAIIYTGLTLEHQDQGDNMADSRSAAGDKSVKDVFETLNEEQKNVVYFMIGEALEADDDEDDDDEVQHSGLGADATIKDVFETLNEDQKNVVYFMIGEAIEDAEAAPVQHSFIQHQEGSSMTRNVFQSHAEGIAAANRPTLTHSQLKSIVEDAQKLGSFKESFLSHAESLGYGIDDIDFLFPDAKTLSNSPEIIGRRQEWVTGVINGAKHSPFSRIKSLAADLTADEARAKGYVKGNLKKDEVIKLLKRVTTPTTIYKKQKLDRDDIVDITDLDVVAWLKAEMRVMLDEELARAVLVGDGRAADDEDKIDEDHIRPIAYDNDMYAHKVTMPSNNSPEEIIEGVLRARTYYKGTGTPDFYTTDAILTDLILLKDKVGRRLYETEASLAAALRVGKIVVVEVMEDNTDLLGVVVNMTDYTLGADKGGAVSMFDDFDIDYNQYKYLLETRVSGALTKPKSAVVIRRASGTSVTPTSPSYNGTTHTITIPTIAGVTYKIDGVTKTGDVVIAETTEVEAFPNADYSFPHNTNRDWVFVYTS